MGIFESPAYKLEIKDLKGAENVKPTLASSSNSNSDSEGWTITLSTSDVLTHQKSRRGRGAANESSSSTSCVDDDDREETLLHPDKEVTLKLTMVWIQGTVIDILSHDDDEQNKDPATAALHISDGTGDAFIYEYKLLPGGDHLGISKGAYIGAIGQIFSTNPDVVIKGAKIMYFSDKPLIKSMWSDEVLLAKTFLLGIWEPDLDSKE